MSDGANTTAVTSQLIRVDEAPPALSLTVPAEAALHAPVRLLAHAVDPEDGLLDGDAVHWESSLDGELGVGRIIDTRSLSVGSHEITVIRSGLSSYAMLGIAAAGVVLLSGGVLSLRRRSRIR